LLYLGSAGGELVLHLINDGPVDDWLPAMPGLGARGGEAASRRGIISSRCACKSITIRQISKTFLIQNIVF
jgi:hypothetical protein